ncbi:hypothetical protein ACLB2K_012547 [Fragaria x ananassa]
MPLSPVKQDPDVQGDTVKEDADVQGDKGQVHIVLSLKGARWSSSSEDPGTEKPDAKRRRWFISSELLDAPHQSPDPDPVPVHQAKPSEDPDVCGDPVQQATPSEDHPDVREPAKPSEPVPLTLEEIMKKHPRRRSKEKQLEYAADYAKWKDPAVIDFHNRVQAFTSEFGGPMLKLQTFTPETLAAAEASKKKHRDKIHVDFLKRRRVRNPNEKDAWNKFVESQKSTWTCNICLKTGDHMSLECPYLDYVPEGASVGPGVEIYCKGCTFKGKHDNTNCVKRAYRMQCCICGAGHWATDCPRAKQHKTNP